MSQSTADGYSHSVEHCAANSAAWIEEVLLREQGLPHENWPGAINPKPCTISNWHEVWPESHADMEHDFDDRHLSLATKLDSGDVKVELPWRTRMNINKAGGPGHYMQFLYVRDETDTIRAIAKFDHPDNINPFVFPASAVQGATKLTPYSVDVKHGVWQGETIDY